MLKDTSTEGLHTRLKGLNADVECELPPLADFDNSSPRSPGMICK